MRDRRLRRLALLAVAAVAVGVGLTALETGALDRVEQSSIDARFQVRGQHPATRGIVVVEIDDTTFNELRRRWPFPRALHAAVIRRLTAAGARAIAYDVQFTEPTTPAQDNALIEAAAHAPRLVLATTEVNRNGGSDVFGGDAVVRGIGARVGNAVLDPDTDGVQRRFSHTVQGLVSFPVVVAERVTGRKVGTGSFGGGGAWIDYAGPPDTFRTIPFSRVLRGEVPPNVFRNRIVVVGAGAPSLQDVHTTPTSGRGPMAGPEVWANAIGTLLSGLPLRSTPGWLDVVLVALLGLVVPAVGLRFGVLPTLGAAVGAAVLYVVGAQVAFDDGRIVPAVPPLLALALGTLGTLGVVGFLAAFHHERTRAQFARFVPEAVVDTVLADAGGARLGGVRSEATVLFCDLRGSTTMLEHMAPERGIEVINRYLTAMTDAVVAHGGTLAGFRGDGLLALFGVPLAQPDHADRALAAAREMAGPRLAAVNASLREEGLAEDLEIGIGVCSGEVMAGNVGSDQRMEYTAIGDAANVASRLEGLTKGTGHRVFVADATRALLQDGAGDGLVEVDELQARGRRGRVRTWTLA
jgi:adenylate cyclase